MTNFFLFFSARVVFYKKLKFMKKNHNIYQNESSFTFNDFKTNIRKKPHWTLSQENSVHFQIATLNVSCFYLNFFLLHLVFFLLVVSEKFISRTSILTTFSPFAVFSFSLSFTANTRNPFFLLNLSFKFPRKTLTNFHCQAGMTRDYD